MKRVFQDEKVQGGAVVTSQGVCFERDLSLNEGVGNDSRRHGAFRPSRG